MQGMDTDLNNQLMQLVNTKYQDWRQQVGAALAGQNPTLNFGQGQMGGNYFLLPQGDTVNLPGSTPYLLTPSDLSTNPADMAKKIMQSAEWNRQYAQGGGKLQAASQAVQAAGGQAATPQASAVPQATKVETPTATTTIKIEKPTMSAQPMAPPQQGMGAPATPTAGQPATQFPLPGTYQAPDPRSALLMRAYSQLAGRMGR